MTYARDRTLTPTCWRVDKGFDDTGLVRGVACLCDHERSLSRLEAAQDALEHEATAVRVWNLRCRPQAFCR